MRKRIIGFAVAGALIATGIPILGSATFADQGGVPHDGSCGVGMERSAFLRSIDESPGASEARNHGQFCNPD